MNKHHKSTFPLSAMIFWTVLIGNIGGAYLLIWKSLRLMNKNKDARNFLILGGFILIFLTTLGYFSGDTNFRFKYYASLLISVLGLLWFNFKFLINWQKNTHTHKAYTFEGGFTVIGLSILGLILTITISFLTKSFIETFL